MSRSGSMLCRLRAAGFITRLCRSGARWCARPRTRTRCGQCRPSRGRAGVRDPEPGRRAGVLGRPRSTQQRPRTRQHDTRADRLRCRYRPDRPGEPRALPALQRHHRPACGAGVTTTQSRLTPTTAVPGTVTRCATRRPGGRQRRGDRRGRDLGAGYACAGRCFLVGGFVVVGHAGCACAGFLHGRGVLGGWCQTPEMGVLRSQNPRSATCGLWQIAI